MVTNGYPTFSSLRSSLGKCWVCWTTFTEGDDQTGSNRVCWLVSSAGVVTNGYQLCLVCWAVRSSDIQSAPYWNQRDGCAGIDSCWLKALRLSFIVLNKEIGSTCFVVCRQGSSGWDDCTTVLSYCWLLVALLQCAMNPEQVSRTDYICSFVILIDIAGSTLWLPSTQRLRFSDLLRHSLRGASGRHSRY